MVPRPYLAIDCRNVLGEMPIWSEEQAALYWIDVVSPGAIYRWHAPGAVTRVTGFDDLVTGLRLTRSGELLVSGSRDVFRFDPATGRRASVFSLPDPKRQYRLNDGACDRAGRLWLGSMRNNIAADGRALPLEACDGRLLCIEEGREARFFPPGFGCPNAICWSPDGGTLYVADSCDGWLYSYEFDGEPAAHRKPFARLYNRGIPDGAAVDREGFIWNARWDGACVVRFDSAGQLAQTVHLPVSRPTACCFGGADGTTLYVTSARFGLTAAQLDREPHAGGVFALEVEVPGAPVHRFG